jgi:taurine dioxygenase
MRVRRLVDELGEWWRERPGRADPGPELRDTRALRVVPTDGPLGARVVGVDLARALPEATIEQIVRAFGRHHVLVFPDQKLERERLLEVASWFGPIYVPSGDVPVLGPPSQPVVACVSNVEEGGVFGHGRLAPHSDLQYLPEPALGTLLYAVEVPRRGGDTSWSNLIRAYDELDPATRLRIERLRIEVHNPYAGSNAAYRAGGPNQMYVEQELPPAVHPLVRTHPPTGRKSLFLGAFAGRILGLDDPSEAAALLQRLRWHVDRRHLYYRHRWRVGDLVVWDNRCTNHKRRSFSPSARRVLYRVQIAGTKPE